MTLCLSAAEISTINCNKKKIKICFKLASINITLVKVVFCCRPLKCMIWYKEFLDS